MPSPAADDPGRGTGGVLSRLPAQLNYLVRSRESPDGSICILPEISSSLRISVRVAEKVRVDSEVEEYSDRGADHDFCIERFRGNRGIIVAGMKLGELFGAEVRFARWRRLDSNRAVRELSPAGIEEARSAHAPALRGRAPLRLAPRAEVRAPPRR